MPKWFSEISCIFVFYFVASLLCQNITWLLSSILLRLCNSIHVFLFHLDAKTLFFELNCSTRSPNAGKSQCYDASLMYLYPN